jgi:hypothetical protein
MTIVQLLTDDLAVSEVGGETFILDLNGSRYFAASGVGVRIIQLLHTEHSHDQLVDTIVGEYGVDRNVADQDVTEFVAQLRHHRLVA